MAAPDDACMAVRHTNYEFRSILTTMSNSGTTLAPVSLLTAAGGAAFVKDA
jgi:hypothetical protein